MRSPAWLDAMLAAATDCIDIRVDSRFPMLNCDLNTGLVYMRSHPTTIAFTARWRETIASAKEIRVRDQAAFNMLLKARRLRYLRGRLFAGANGESEITLGLLPLSQFLNGHTFFVQHAHTLPNAAPPLSVHLTYQFAEGSTFAHGKRQRMRQAGLWLVASATPGLTVTRAPGIRITASSNTDALRALGRNPLTIRATRFDTLRGLVDLMDLALAAAPRMPPLPTLALYGAQDEIIPKPATRATWSQLPGPPIRRLYYREGYHLLLRDLARAAPLADIAAWLQNPAAPLPSGAEAEAAAWLATPS
jgi:pimeloyl-ACP methyl ester carboxylesterase